MMLKTSIRKRKLLSWTNSLFLTQKMISNKIFKAPLQADMNQSRFLIKILDLLDVRKLSSPKKRIKITEKIKGNLPHQDPNSRDAIVSSNQLKKDDLHL